MIQKVILFMPPSRFADFMKKTRNFVMLYSGVAVFNAIMLVGSLWMATTIDPAYQQFISARGPMGDPHAMFLQKAMAAQVEMERNYVKFMILIILDGIC